jgi:vitamin B12 transporter
VTCCALLVVPRGVAAEDSSADEPTIRVYETATVTARPLTRATASVTVLEREEIEAIGVATVAELMRFIPGLSVTTTGSRAGFATAQIRGGDPNFTFVMIDGVPLNDITDQVGGAVDLNSLSTRAIERIEVVRGPLSSFYGSTGLGGAINIITRRGHDATGVGLGLAAGNDSVIQGRVSYGREIAPGDYFVTAWYEQEKGAVANDEFRQIGVQGNTRIETGDSSELKLTGRFASWETDDYAEGSGGPVAGTGETRNSEHNEISLGAEWNYGRTARRQRIHALTYRHELERESPVIPPGPSGFNPDAVEDSLYSNLRIGWSMPQIAVGKKTQIAFGVEAVYEDGKNDAVLGLPPPFPMDGSFVLDRWIGGAFVEVLAEAGPVLFEVGARVDVPEGFDTEFSPRLGIRYRAPNETTRLRGSIGRAYKLPSFFALGHPLVGNPDLVPEIVTGGDAGIDQLFAGGKVDLTVTLFYNEFRDLVDFDFGTLSNVNESVEARGVELGLAWFPIAAIDVRANATYQDVERQDSDEPLRHRPEWVGGLRFLWRPTARLGWEIDGQWVSEQHDEQIPTGPGVVAGYQLFGSAFTYTIGDAWKVLARVDNLADKKFETMQGFPGPGRTFLLGVHRTL